MKKVRRCHIGTKPLTRILLRNAFLNDVEVFTSRVGPPFFQSTLLVEHSSGGIKGMLVVGLVSQIILYSETLTVSSWAAMAPIPP
jgi:hypothetical protein